MASVQWPPVAPLARVDVAAGELDVLFLVVQYLRDLGLSTSVVALLRESGVDPFWLCGPSREVALLREWVFQGEWARVRSLLEPLRPVVGDRGHSVAIALVTKHELLEQFYLRDTTLDKRREVLEKLRGDRVARLTKHELQRCVRAMQKEEKETPSTTWSLDEARLACFESLVPLFRDDINDDDDESKYLAMPRRQLVALLNDALLLHKKRTGGDEDMVSVKSLSPDRVVEDQLADEVSSLRLTTVGPIVQETQASHPLTRSIDLSNARGFPVQTGHHEAWRAQSRLGMSMDLSGGQYASRKRQPSQDSQPSAHDLDEESREEDERGEATNTAGVAHESRICVDAEIQTDVPAAMQTPDLNGVDLMVSPSDVESPQEIHGSNQTIEELSSEERKEASPSRRPSLIRSSGPQEAWQACREEKREAPIVFADEEPQHELTSSVGKPEATPATQNEDDEEPTSPIDRDEDQESNDDGWRESEEAESPRSYAQLTVDSVVRARVVAEVREAQAIRALDIAADGSEMVIGTNARALRVFDLTEPLANSTTESAVNRSFLPLLPVSLERHKHHSSPIYTACYNHVSPTRLIATGAAESSIKVLSRWAHQEVWIRGHSGKSRALQFASPSLLCSAASGDMVIRVWDVETTSGDHCVQRLDGHVGEIQAMAVSGTPLGGSVGPVDHHCLISSSMDRTVRLWDLRAAQCVRVVARTASPAFALALQPPQTATRVLATGHQDGSVAIWDLRTSSSKAAKPLATVSHHQDECRAVSWSPDGYWLLSASFDRTLCLLDARDGLSAVASFHQHEDKILQAKWHPTVPAVVTTGADKLVKLWGFA